MPTPEISSIVPLTGKPEGGDEVVVHGQHLDEVTQVSVGTAGQVDTTTISENELKFITPPWPSGGPETDRHMGLTFHTREGHYLSDGWMVFVYEGHVPLVLSVEPSFVHPHGGDTVHVGGEHLDMITHVAVGPTGTVEAMPAHDGLTFVCPPLSEDLANQHQVSMGLSFYLADGSSVSWPNGLVYSYPYATEPTLTEHTADSGQQALAPGGRPTVDRVQPDHGPAAGGDWVSITGTDLENTASVTFGGVPAHFDNGPDNSIYAYPPAYDHAQMGGFEVAVEVHSHVHGVSLERLSYRYDGLDATAGHEASGLGEPGTDRQVSSPGAGIGSGSTDQLRESGPQ